MNRCDLINDMRMLWEQHITWTRLTIISIAANLLDREVVIQRLLRNAADMADVIRLYYGDEVASKFGKLMKGHLMIAVVLVEAAKSGNSSTVADAERRWYANADQIAAFLGSINHFWPEETLKMMLHEHLALTEAEAVFRLNKNYMADIAQYDKVEKQALAMADAISNGIINQFPDQFLY